MADEAYHIGASVAAESYLNGDKLIAVCRRAGADALHPGYGFLSENADFAQSVKEAGINFIGPTPESIRAIGDKIAAKLFITEHAPSIPLIPGYNGHDQSIERLEKEASRIGKIIFLLFYCFYVRFLKTVINLISFFLFCCHIEFPVLLKASAGGGGRGMRAVYETNK